MQRYLYENLQEKHAAWNGHCCLKWVWWMIQAWPMACIVCDVASLTAVRSYIIPVKN